MTLPKCETTGKVIYDNPHHTKAAHRHLTGGRIRAYRCEHCHGWHATTQPGRKRFRP